MTPAEKYLADCLRATASLRDQGFDDEFMVTAWGAYMIGMEVLLADTQRDLAAPLSDDNAHSQSSGSGVHAANKFPVKDDQDAVSRPPVAPAPLPE